MYGDFRAVGFYGAGAGNLEVFFHENIERRRNLFLKRLKMIILKIEKLVGRGGGGGVGALNSWVGGGGVIKKCY